MINIIGNILLLVLLVGTLYLGYNLYKYHFEDDLGARNIMINLTPSLFIIVIGYLLIIVPNTITRKQRERQQNIEQIQILNMELEKKDSIINDLKLKSEEFEECDAL